MLENDTCPPKNCWGESSRWRDLTDRRLSLAIAWIGKETHTVGGKLSRCPNDIEEQLDPQNDVFQLSPPEYKCGSGERARNPILLDSTFLPPCRVGTQIKFLQKNRSYIYWGMCGLYPIYLPPSLSHLNLSYPVHHSPTILEYSGSLKYIKHTPLFRVICI